jgi:hypothetical protein
MALRSARASLANYFAMTSYYLNDGKHINVSNVSKTTE